MPKEIFEYIFDQYTKHTFYSDTVIDEENFNYDLRPQYVPDGFKLSQANFLNMYTELRYENEDSRLLIQYSTANDGGFSIDNEHTKKKDIYIDGNLSVFYESIDEDNPSYLIFVKSGYSFIITAQISQENFVEMAESFKIG